MSATINYEKFSKYFNDAPVLEIPGFAHPVTDLYVWQCLQVDYSDALWSYLEDIEPLLCPQDENVKTDLTTRNKEQLHGSQTNEPRRRNNRSRIDYQVINYSSIFFASDSRLYRS